VSEARPELRNIREILTLEQEAQNDLSALDQAADWVTGMASGPSFVVVHVLWFGIWIALNASGAAAFDPAYNLLMLIVSIEAIMLTGFVLRAQGRMTLQAEKRAHLDLQVNMLAEQELTAILRVLCALGERLGIDVASCDPRVEHFRAQTDVRNIATTLASEQAGADK
jgi:uncharacterized membrane protein